jgi:hypothetical protein
MSTNLHGPVAETTGVFGPPIIRLFERDANSSGAAA